MNLYGGLFVVALLYPCECRQSGGGASDAALVMTSPPELYCIHGDSGLIHPA